ncbi:MAG: acyl-CoA dehydrogenase family protein [Acidimicrobiia bacterium]|nr:acyl-CoA dehydrogenase family protein [Acidimicrobiia bacterium]
MTENQTREARETSSLRAEVRGWLDQNWDPEMSTREWWERLAASGWGFPHWPADHGGLGMTHAASAVVVQEMVAAGVLGPPGGAAPTMGAPIVFAYGTAEQRRRWLPSIARGLEGWAQFFSEPGAGSDLASVQTRAVRDGDEWIVNGQKVWNSGTMESDKALLVARTDVDVPKHRGIGFFIVDVHQPGIEIRPIKQMNGSAEFNEAFFTDARVSDADRIGEPNQGWAVALHVLTHERASHPGGGDGVLKQVHGGERAGYLDRPAGQVMLEADDERTANRLPISDLDSLLALAREHGRLDDPVIRQRIAHLHAFGESLRLTQLRALVSTSEVGTETSVVYLGAVRLVRLYRDLIGDIAGAAALLDCTDVSDSILTAPCHGIQGGAEQIQMNLIGERILGLPKEPQIDRDVPFKDLRVGTQRVTAAAASSNGST